MDISDIFNFSCSGRGKGESEAAGRGGGVDFLLKILEGGVSRRRRGRGAGRVSAANWGFLGRGANFFFFFGAEMSCPQSNNLMVRCLQVFSALCMGSCSDIAAILFDGDLPRTRDAFLAGSLSEVAKGVWRDGVGDKQGEERTKYYLSHNYIGKVWVSIMFLSAKFVPPPPPKRPKMMKKCAKSVENPQN